jgi:hypothetical protein
MVCFLLRGAEELLSRLLRAGSQCLSLIEGLCADLSGVVHPHQARGMLALAWAQCRLIVADRRGGSRCCFGERYGFARQLTKPLVDATQKAVDAAKGSSR